MVEQRLDVLHASHTFQRTLLASSFDPSSNQNQPGKKITIPNASYLRIR
jgi:hypothetical protein